MPRVMQQPRGWFGNWPPVIKDEVILDENEINNSNNNIKDQWNLIRKLGDKMNGIMIDDDDVKNGNNDNTNELKLNNIKNDILKRSLLCVNGCNIGGLIFMNLNELEDQDYNELNFLHFTKVYEDMNCNEDYIISTSVFAIHKLTNKIVWLEGITLSSIRYMWNDMNTFLNDIIVILNYWYQPNVHHINKFPVVFQYVPQLNSKSRRCRMPFAYEWSMKLYNNDIDDLMNALNEEPLTALYNTNNSITENSFLGDAVQVGNITLMKKLLECKADINYRSSISSNCVIHIAAMRNQIDCMKLLLNHKANPNSEGYHNKSPLHIAVEYNHNEMTRILIEAKADVNHVDDSKATSLTRAFYGYETTDINIIHALIDSNADVNHIDDNDDCILVLALKQYSKNKNANIHIQLLLKSEAMIILHESNKKDQSYYEELLSKALA